MSDDPFDIIGEIPAGQSYQWVALSVLGSEQLAEYSFRKILVSDWTPVPPARHPNMPSAGERIVVGGQVLLERSAAKTGEARAREVESARKMKDDKETFFVSNFDYAKRAISFDTAVFEKAKAALKHNECNGPYYADVTIGVTVSDSDIETAVFVLGITPQEYIKRRVYMDTAILINRSSTWRRDGDAIFSRAELDVKASA